MVLKVLGTTMRLGPGSREVGAGGLMEEDGPRGFFTGLAVADAVRTRTLWGPWTLGASVVEVETVRGVGLSLTGTGTLRGPSVDFPTVFDMVTTGLGMLPVADDSRTGGRTILVR